MISDNILTLTQVANAGIMISYNEVDILCDCVFSQEVAPFGAPAENTVTAILENQKPFDCIAAILCTHLHHDHTNPKLLHRLRNKNAPIILPRTGQCRCSLENIKNPLYILTEDSHRFHFEGLTVDAIRTVHDGGAQYAIEHYSFLLNLSGVRVLILGDADPEGEQLALHLRSREVDVACVNFMEINRGRGRKLIDTIICPKQLVLYHIPFSEDFAAPYQNMVRRNMKLYEQKLPPTQACFSPSKRLTFSLPL